MTAGQPIPEDIICRRCGYNLRGLDETGRCPECGTPVGLSTRGDMLRFADPRWLAKLRIGLGLMITGAAFVVAMQLQNFVLPLRMPFIWQPFIYFTFMLITISGVWLLTAPDPGGLAEEQYVTVRKLIRITVVVGLGYRIFYLGTTATTVSPDLRRILIVVAVAVGLVNLVGEYAKFVYLSRLAERVPNRRLARTAQAMKWIVPAASLPTVILSAVFGLRLVSTTSRSFEWLGLVLGLQRLGVIAVMIFVVILYGIFARVVHEQHAIAMRTWSTAEGVKA
jgi:hypothetical protein